MDRKEQIRQLRAQGLSYMKISEALNVDKAYAWRICTGKDIAHPRRLLKDVPPALSEEEIARRVRSLELGAISEALVCVRLMSLGFDVWKPFLPTHRADLAVAFGRRLVRVQVKTAGYEEKSRRFRTSLMNKRRGTFISYRDGELEFFIVKCSGVEEYYVVPATVGIKAGYLNLYPTRDRLMESWVDYEVYRNNFELLRSETPEGAP